MGKLRAIMKTTAARLSTLYLLLFAVCAVLLVFYMTAMSVRMLTVQIKGAINQEVSALGRFYRNGGVPLMVRVMERRARQPGANLYLIADASGRILGGNVESLAPGVLDRTGWTERPFRYRRFGELENAANPAQRRGTEGRSHKHQAIAQVFRLPNKMIVLVGRDLREPERFRLVVRRALMFALAIMGVGGLLIWFFVGRRALKRIDNVSAASQRIMGGDLTGRLPVTGAGDEFDRLSENLNLMLDRIDSLNVGLKQVSDNIAHDLKTPLTRLRNRAESALSGKKTGAEYREALESTIAESDQMIRTFNAILMISRLEAGYSSETTELIDLSASLSDVVELYEPVADEAGVALKTGSVQQIKIRGNRELVGQALSNIVDNAIKYSAGATDNPSVTVSLETAGSDVRLTVADNGPGVPGSESERVTERFVRLEASRTQPGSGLGLSLAKAVMTFHGGSLELSDNEPGLRVTMRFDASRRPET